MLTFFSDTDCDITPKECAAYGIKMISMPYTVGEQVIYPYIDFDEFNYHKFYDMLRAGTMPTTSAMSEELVAIEFVEIDVGVDYLIINGVWHAYQLDAIGSALFGSDVAIGVAKECQHSTKI